MDSCEQSSTVLLKIQLLPWKYPHDIESLLKVLRRFEVEGKALKPFDKVYIDDSNYFVVLFCDPICGGLLSDSTQVFATGKPLVPLQKVHFLALPPFNAALSPLAQKVPITRLNRAFNDEGEFNGDLEVSASEVEGLCDKDQLCKLYIEPYFQKNKREPVYVGRKICAGEIEFLVWACDPFQIGVIGKDTAIYIDWDCFGEFKRIHVIPFSDTLPQTYSFDIFQDYLKPFLSRYKFHPFSEGESFTYNGVQFKVIATDPIGVKARIGDNTTIYCQGSLTPSIIDLLPTHLLENIVRLPPISRPFSILQALAHLPPSDVDRIFGSADSNNNRGVNEEIVSKITQKSYIYGEEGLTCSSSDDVPLCTVCLSEMNRGEHVVKLDCQHIFHLHCIKEWFRMSVICPLCKIDVRNSSS
ncbi:putative RING zinc finger protein [Cryptosporidium felis]|nr:putative RING zinc finger protein [Cryptosporidium felis]